MKRFYAEATVGQRDEGGFGILLDDFAAALCTLLVIALWKY